MPGAEFETADIDAFNAQTDFEYGAIRDFIILHYHVNRRHGSDFWRRCRQMTLPESLAAKIALFEANGRIARSNLELFDVPIWLQVMWGQGLRPRGYHPLADRLTSRELDEFIDTTHKQAARVAAQMPAHEDFIAAHCAAPATARPFHDFLPQGAASSDA